jgi:methionine-rich copper-binding protein CopC
MPARTVLGLAVALAIAAFHALPAQAHAILVEAAPAPGAVVAGPAVDIRLRFNTRIDHIRSGILLIAADGRETKVVIATDGAPADVLAGKAANLTAGRYRLRWQVLAVDGHITRGDVEFTVRSP